MNSLAYFLHPKVHEASDAHLLDLQHKQYIKISVADVYTDLLHQAEYLAIVFPFEDAHLYFSFRY